MTSKIPGSLIFARMTAALLLILIQSLFVPLVSAQNASTSARHKSLNGQIHQSARVSRPGVSTLRPSNGAASGRQLDLHLDTALFNQKPLSGQTSETPLDIGISAAPSVPVKSAPLIEATPPTVPEPTPVKLSGSTTKIPAKETGGSGGGGEPNYDYGKKAPRTGKKILIRIKKFRSGQEMEVVWEAARVANAMAKKGADVTVLLDMEAVHAASKSYTMNALYEPNRGNGNSAAPRLTTPQDLLAEFVQNGGRLCISLRWAKLYGMAGGGSVAMPGAVMLSDEEIADLLLESDNCIDY